MTLSDKFKDYTHLYVRENYYANLFHDSIRGKEALEKLSLYVGTWAANYTMLYVLNRIMAQYQPQNILELGLGESSKLINTYLKQYNEGDHTIIEHDTDWLEFVTANYNFGKDSEILHIPMVPTVVNGYDTNVYDDLPSYFKDQKFDLYLVDGPIGSKRYSRSNILGLAEQLIEKEDEFIILLDDNDREGEIDTRTELIEILNKKGIITYRKEYIGIKSIFVIVTEKFKYVATF